MLTLPDRSALAGGPPEWEPWLAFVEEVLREAADPAWEKSVPDLPPAMQPDLPLLAGAVVSLDRATLARFLQRVHHVLLARGTPALSAAAAVFASEKESLEIFHASLAGENDTIATIAARHATDAEAVAAVGSMLPVPFLQACHRRLASRVSEGWSRGYCPVCGAWPAFVEVLDSDRTRRSRCGRCGGAWAAAPLLCGFCGNADHNGLVTLLPDGGDRQGTVEACARCSCYLKTFTALHTWPPLDVMRQDLASVAFDFAAIAEGYARPSGTGYALHMTVQEG